MGGVHNAAQVRILAVLNSLSIRKVLSIRFDAHTSTRIAYSWSSSDA